MGCEVVGTDDYLPDLKQKGFCDAFITVGSIRDNHIRAKLAAKVGSLGFNFPTIIDPSATVAKSSLIHQGTFVGKNVVVNVESEIGQHCIINTGAIIEHECRVCDFTHVSVGATLCGQVNVGKHSFVGAGSVIIQGLSVGDNVVVANCTVITSIDDNIVYYGIGKN